MAGGGGLRAFTFTSMFTTSVFVRLPFALLFLVARVTSIPCFHATATPGAKVLQVFHHVREDRLDLLRVYSPLVAGQFALTHEDVVWPGFHTTRCLNSSNTYYVQCLAGMLQRLESSSGLQGDGEAPCSSTVHVAGESARARLAPCSRFALSRRCDVPP